MAPSPSVRLLQLLQACREEMQAFDGNPAATMIRQISGERTLVLLRKRKVPPFEFNLPAGVGPVLCMPPSAVALADQFVQECMNDSRVKGVSRQAVELYRDALLGYVQWVDVMSEQQILDLLDETIKDLAATVTSRKVFFPVENLRFTGVEDLRIGWTTFRPISALDTISVYLQSNVQADDSQQKDRLEQMVRQHVALFRKCDAFAEVEIDAEMSAAYELAQEQLEISLQLLRVMSVLVFPRQTSSHIGMPAVTRATAFEIHDDGYSFSPKMQTLGSSIYVLNPETMQRLRQSVALDTLSDLLRKPATRRTPIEAALTQSITWIARAVTSTSAAESIVLFAAAIEVLLMGQQNRPDSPDKFAMRLAQYLGGPASLRLENFRWARHVYNTRTIILHTGIADLKNVNLIELRNSAVLVMLWVNGQREKWKTFKDIDAHFEAQLFGQ